MEQPLCDTELVTSKDREAFKTMADNDQQRKSAENTLRYMQKVPESGIPREMYEMWVKKSEKKEGVPNDVSI